MANEVKAFLNDVVADGCIIGDNTLGIVEQEGDFPIVPKNLMVSFEIIEECEHCAQCSILGDCVHNLCTYEVARVSKVGGKKHITFTRWCERKVGSLWTKWVRDYGDE